MDKKLAKNHIIIPMTHDSLRFAGKNEKLLQYTLDWLSREGVDDYDVWMVYSEGAPKKRCWGILHDVYCPAEIKDDHKAVLRWAVSYIEWQGGQVDDNYIQLQTTQPRRRKGLLSETIQTLRFATNDEVVVSYVLADSPDWRCVDEGTIDKITNRSDNLHKYYDGAIYAWRGNNSDLIFDLPNADKLWVCNGHQYVCDIDYEWQYRCFVGEDILD